MPTFFTSPGRYWTPKQDSHSPLMPGFGTGIVVNICADVIVIIINRDICALFYATHFCKTVLSTLCTYVCSAEFFLCRTYLLFLYLHPSACNLLQNPSSQMTFSKWTGSHHPSRKLSATNFVSRLVANSSHAHAFHSISWSAHSMLLADLPAVEPRSSRGP